MSLTVSNQNGSGRLLDSVTNQLMGRLFDFAQASRLARDSVLADAVWAARNLATNARRSAIRTALQNWVAAGGRLVDLRTMTLLNEDGNQNFVFGGQRIGYIHGELYNSAPVLRFITLTEELADAEALSTLAERNAALDAAVTKYVNSGGPV